MQLQTGAGRDERNPCAEQLADALAGLTGGQDSFAVLHRDEEVYLQAIGSAREGFYLEYRDGSEASHFQACAPLSLAAAVWRMAADL